MTEGVSVVEGRSRRVGRGVPDRWAIGAGLYFVWQQVAVERKDTVLDVSERRPGVSADAGAAGAAAEVSSLTHSPPHTWSLFRPHARVFPKVWPLCET